MSLERISEAQSLADAAMAAMQRYEIPATPENYALWYEYHAGHSPDLRRTIDVLISNNARFDERTLYDLSTTFFSSFNEEQAVRETAVRVQETLQDVIALADRARSDAREFGSALNGVAATGFGKSVGDLKELIQNLVCETQRMAGRSEYVGFRLRKSSEKIAALERNLAGAIREATLDGLTGIANRKSFDAELRKLAGEAMNSGEDLSLLLIDIDHFKDANDTWGHLVGDALLCYLARTLEGAVRRQDYLARYGGEEFAILLPRTDLSDAVKVGGKIRDALDREPPRLEMTAMDPMTVSIGVASYEPGEPLAEWIGRSDAALYRAKKQGRNRVVFA